MMRSRPGCVEAVAPGSSAEKAGLHVGDVLQWCGARPLRSAFDFVAARENASGSAITLKGLRANQPLMVICRYHCREYFRRTKRRTCAFVRNGRLRCKLCMTPD